MMRLCLFSPQREAVATAKSASQKLQETLLVGVENNKADQQAAQVLDGAYSAQYYHLDKIIRQYDAERKAATGVYPVSYLAESDFEGFATTGLGVLKPENPETRPVRVSQFDGLPAATATSSEIALHGKALALETLLVSGFSDTALFYTLLDSVSATSVGQTVTFRATSISNSSIAGKRLIFSQANNAGAIIVKVISNTTTSTLPPYTHSFTAEALTVGSVVAGTLGIGTFGGFTHAVRTSGVATSGQQVLTSLKAQYQQNLSERLAFVAEQELAVLLNDDAADKPSFIYVKAELQAPLDISDGGIAQRVQQRANREAAVQARTSTINQRLISLYQSRYELAILRLDRNTGSLSKLKALVASAATLFDNLQKTKSQIDNLKKIFPF